MVYGIDKETYNDGMVRYVASKGDGSVGFCVSFDTLKEAEKRIKLWIHNHEKEIGYVVKTENISVINK